MFEVLDKVCTPIRGTGYKAYISLFAREDIDIIAGESGVVKLGVKLDLNRGFLDRYALSLGVGDNGQDFGEYYENLKQNFCTSHYLEVALLPSLGLKGLISANGIEIINLDDTNEISITIHNPISSGNIESNVAMKNFYWRILRGQEVAQCTIKEHKGYLMGY